MATSLTEAIDKVKDTVHDAMAAVRGFGICHSSSHDDEVRGVTGRIRTALDVRATWVKIARERLAADPPHHGPSAFSLTVAWATPSIQADLLGRTPGPGQRLSLISKRDVADRQ